MKELWPSFIRIQLAMELEIDRREQYLFRHIQLHYNLSSLNILSCYVLLPSYSFRILHLVSLFVLVYRGGCDNTCSEGGGIYSTVHDALLVHPSIYMIISSTTHTTHQICLTPLRVKQSSCMTYYHRYMYIGKQPILSLVNVVSKMT